MGRDEDKANWEGGSGSGRGRAGGESQGPHQREKLLEQQGCALSQETGIAGLTLQELYNHLVSFPSERPRDTHPTWFVEARQGDPREPPQPPEKSRETGSQVREEWRYWVGGMPQ